jgi:hypothetical protein
LQEETPQRAIEQRQAKAQSTPLLTRAHDLQANLYDVIRSLALDFCYVRV